MKANPAIIQMWANRRKCLMCKHRKDEGHIFPGKAYNPSPKWMFHYEDTHGLPHDLVIKWIWNKVYGLPLTIGAENG